MDAFSSPSSGSPSSHFSTEEFVDQLKTQLAQAYAEEFLEVIVSFHISISLTGAYLKLNINLSHFLTSNIHLHLNLGRRNVKL